MPLILALLFALAPADGDYVRTIAEWRAARAERLASEGGWLTVAGLSWLTEGRHRVGSASSADVRLPESAPAHVGDIVVDGRRVEFIAATGVAVTADGRPVDRLVLDDEEKTLAVGAVSFNVIERGSRRGVRVRDRNAPARRAFKGLSWYPIDPRWRVAARLVPPAAPRRVPIATIVGDVVEMESAGDLVFTAAGREVRLEAVFESSERTELFLMFKDRTNGDATYGAGRYMYLPVPEDGRLEIDFNKAYNPPCAYTDFATCPLPPGQNWLQIPVEAGEQNYRKPDSAKSSKSG